MGRLRQRPAQTARAVFSRVPTGAVGGLARSLYLHVPFCFHKCHYCDFYSIVDTRDRQEPFVERLERELAAVAPWAGRGLRTIFVGGGTPSLLRVELWTRLLRVLHERFDLAGLEEFTVECNPETVTPELMGVLAAGGVNRVSVGAQSFDRRHLKTLERWHEPESVARALGLARAAGIGRQSVDLIFGIPGQTPAEWERELAAGLGLGTGHISCYDLTYEPNTAMTARLKRGEFAPADEEDEVAMFEATLRMCRAAGLQRYEVSNFARPGEECRHNLAYWRQEEWLAAGPSASGHLGGHRWKNTPRLDDYLSLDDEGFAPIAEHEGPDAGRAERERIMTGLRLAEGLEKSSPQRHRGTERMEEEQEKVQSSNFKVQMKEEELGRLIAGYVRDGLLIDESGRWRLTDAGFLLADRIAGDLMACVRAEEKITTEAQRTQRQDEEGNERA